MLQGERVLEDEGPAELSAFFPATSRQCELVLAVAAHLPG